jgi:hypothetical protein
MSGEVTEAGARVNGKETGQAVVGGERAGEGMGGTRDLTSGPGLPVGEQRERERGGAADRWGRSVRRGCGRGHGLGWKQSSLGGKGFSFFPFFCFLFHISIFYFYFFLFPFLLNQQFAK